ncbi:MAG: phosphoribosyltransferase [Myxococcaceae bacterium]
MAVSRKGRKPKKQQVQRMVSIPRDVVLSPQSELPRHVRGQDRSRRKKSVEELSWRHFDELIQQLAKEVQETFKPQAVVGVAHGGVFVGGAVASALGCEFFPVRISRRSRDHKKRVKQVAEMPAELKKRRTLIVDDVASSGDTLELAIALAKKVGAGEIKTACLVRREEGYSPDWYAISTDGLVVFPWDYQTVVEDERFEVDPDKAGA